MRPVPCGGLGWPLTGKWLALRSFGGWLDDTVSYVPDEASAQAWVLTLREDGTFTSRRGQEKVEEGTATLSQDASGPNGGALLSFSVGFIDPTGDFYPEFRGDTLLLRNAWTDAYDHLFVRYQ